ncbi:MAG: IS1380 family transposase, partial [Actinomycetota bacterium]
NHMPSGRFGANAAWLALNAIAHNLVRWVSRIGLEETLVMTKTGSTTSCGATSRPASGSRRTATRS